MATPLHTTRAEASPLGVALAFLGMFVVGSLGVQLLSTLPRDAGQASATAQSASAQPAPVVAHQATLWSSLGER
ncbi:MULTISPECIES: hypothetical protein [Aphanothece]|uniref:hypothetical protein n=1 Tax=Aphanothece TaxID=1121 RepID=UPI00398F7AFD